MYNALETAALDNKPVSLAQHPSSTILQKLPDDTTCRLPSLSHKARLQRRVGASTNPVIEPSP